MLRQRPFSPIKHCRDEVFLVRVARQQYAANMQYYKQKREIGQELVDFFPELGGRIFTFFIRRSGRGEGPAGR